MYKKIINPNTGRKVSINSRLGKNILNNYITNLYGGDDYVSYTKKCLPKFSGNCSIKNKFKKNIFVKKNSCSFKSKKACKNKKIVGYKVCNWNEPETQEFMCPKDCELTKDYLEHEENFDSNCEDPNQGTINAKEPYEYDKNDEEQRKMHTCFNFMHTCVHPDENDNEYEDMEERLMNVGRDHSKLVNYNFKGKKKSFRIAK